MAQLKSTNITGNLAVTGNILASKIIKLGGTVNDILLGNGDVVTLTTQSTAPNSTTATAGRTYKVQKNGNDLVVNVPWVAGSTTTGTVSSVDLSVPTGLVVEGGPITSTGTLEVSLSTGYTIPLQADVDKGITAHGWGNHADAGYLTSHQSLADYVKGPGSSTSNAIAVFNGTGGKTIKNTGVTIDSSNVISTAGGIKLTNGNCSLRIYNTSASPTDYSAIEVRSNSPSTNRNLFIDLGNNSLVVGAASGTADTTYKVNVKDTFNATTIYENGTALSSTYLGINAKAADSSKLDGKTPETTLSATSNTVIPTSKAVADYVTGLGYITGYTLPLAANGTRGGIQIGYSETENNRALKLNSEKAYVELPKRLYGGRTDSTAPDSALKSGFYYTNGLPASLGFTSNQGTMFVSSYDDDWVAQMVIGCYTDKLAYRKKGTSWTNWKTVATEDWVEGKGYITSLPDLTGYVTGSDLTADYFILGNGGSSIKKGSYRISKDIKSNSTHGYIPTAEAVEDYVRGQISGVGGSDNKTSSSSRANTELKLVGAIDVSENGVETFTNPNCYIGTDNCLYSNGKKVATEEWVETAIKDKISSVTIYSEVLYDADGNLSGSEWTEGWRDDTDGSWDPSVKNDNGSATYTVATVSSSNQTVRLKQPYSPMTTHSRWVMEISASGMHGLSISGVGVTTIANSKYKLQFAATTNQTITLSKGEATFKINIVFNDASYQD